MLLILLGAGSVIIFTAAIGATKHFAEEASVAAQIEALKKEFEKADAIKFRKEITSIYDKIFSQPKNEEKSEVKDLLSAEADETFFAPLS